MARRQQDRCDVPDLELEHAGADDQGIVGDRGRLALGRRLGHHRSIAHRLGREEGGLVEDGLIDPSVELGDVALRTVALSEGPGRVIRGDEPTTARGDREKSHDQEHEVRERGPTDAGPCDDVGAAMAGNLRRGGASGRRGTAVGAIR